MSNTTLIKFPMVEQQPLKTFTESAYLEYSMYVILDRALPHVSDGLKPVQRRIIYAMSELGLTAQAKYKKSARTVGDVLGKFHPHGDTACYEAMVLMAQPFSYRYPFVDGQGNWGSPDDPKSFAAMRYTEARLSPYANTLLAELTQGTVEWVPNFDGTLDEPRLLPARLPNVLLNGTTGIAVGMATDIPPHNVREVIQACIYLLENPLASVETLCRFIPGPDFPTQAEIITPQADMIRLYQTGTGTIRMRAVYRQEKDDIIVSALPHMVSGSKVLEQIAALMQAKKLPMVADLRDESDHEDPIRLVITPRSNRIDVQALMSHLFSVTDLEKTYRVNLNIIGLDGRPSVKNLRAILSEWLQFRMITVRRRLEHRLNKVIARLEILAGLMIAFLNIDEVIRIIRQEDEPKTVLIKTFGLTDTQSEAILELKLRHLAKLEEVKIKTEQEALAQERKRLDAILGSDAKLKNLLKQELTEDSKTYGDDRRSPLVVREAAVPMVSLEKGPVEPVTVILSKKGWIRVAKGHDIDPNGLNYKTGDSFKASVQGKSDEPVVLLDSSGRTYTVMASTLPSARGQGEPLTGHINPPSGVSFEALLMSAPSDRYVLMSTAGYGFTVVFSELLAKNRNGKSILKVKEGFGVLPAVKLPSAFEKMWIALLSQEAKLLIFPVTEISTMAKGKGDKLMSLGKGKYLLSAILISSEQTLLLQSDRKKVALPPKEWKAYIDSMGGRGQKLPKGLEKIQTLMIGN